MVTKFSNDLGNMVISCYSGSNLVATCNFRLDKNKMPKTILCDNVGLTPSSFRYWLRSVLAYDFASLYGKCFLSEVYDEDSDDLFR